MASRSAMENEIRTLREHRAILEDSLKATKNMVKAKEAEVEEAEYQWAASKAAMAQARVVYGHVTLTLTQRWTNLLAH